MEDFLLQNKEFAKVKQRFETVVLDGSKKLKMTNKTVLSDYSLDKKFSKEWTDMLCDRVFREFNVNIVKMKSKPVVEILAIIATKKLTSNTLPPGLQSKQSISENWNNRKYKNG
jgi:hypothetical protein